MKATLQSLKPILPAALLLSTLLLAACGKKGSSDSPNLAGSPSEVANPSQPASPILANPPTSATPVTSAEPTVGSISKVSDGSTTGMPATEPVSTEPVSIGDASNPSPSVTVKNPSAVTSPSEAQAPSFPASESSILTLAATPVAWTDSGNTNPGEVLPVVPSSDSAAGQPLQDILTAPIIDTSSASPVASTETQPSAAPEASQNSQPETTPSITAPVSSETPPVISSPVAEQQASQPVPTTSVSNTSDLLSPLASAIEPTQQTFSPTTVTTLDSSFLGTQILPPASDIPAVISQATSTTLEPAPAAAPQAPVLAPVPTPVVAPTPSLTPAPVSISTPSPEITPTATSSSTPSTSNPSVPSSETEEENNPVQDLQIAGKCNNQKTVLLIVSDSRKPQHSEKVLVKCVKNSFAVRLSFHKKDLPFILIQGLQ